MLTKVMYNITLQTPARPETIQIRYD